MWDVFFLYFVFVLCNVMCGFEVFVTECVVCVCVSVLTGQPVHWPHSPHPGNQMLCVGANRCHKHHSLPPLWWCHMPHHPVWQLDRSLGNNTLIQKKWTYSKGSNKVTNLPMLATATWSCQTRINSMICANVKTTGKNGNGTSMFVTKSPNRALLSPIFPQ